MTGDIGRRRGDPRWFPGVGLSAFRRSPIRKSTIRYRDLLGMRLGLRNNTLSSRLAWHLRKPYTNQKLTLPPRRHRGVSGPGEAA